jgi:hypothetical protein
MSSLPPKPAEIWLKFLRGMEWLQEKLARPVLVTKCVVTDRSQGGSVESHDSVGASQHVRVGRRNVSRALQPARRLCARPT